MNDLEIAQLREALDDELLEEYYATGSDVITQTSWQDENQSSLSVSGEKAVVSPGLERERKK